MGVDWHATCLKCEKCKKTVQPGQHAVHDNKPYCHKPCYAAAFGPTRKLLNIVTILYRFYLDVFPILQLSHERIHTECDSEH